MERKLDVKHLKISFRTVNGKVQAVRDVSFTLDKGETLAIVGESGSGKSVTSRAILGILANNAIIEGGEVIYDGKDLLKISEDDFHEIRGDKIAMIFQDPLSSLNPIMRIGKQLTEAMLLKNKVNRRVSKSEFNAKISGLLRCMDLAMGAETNAAVKAENKRKIESFDKFEKKHLELEQLYNDAYECAKETVDDIENMLIEIPKFAVKDYVKSTQEITKEARKTINRFVVNQKAERLQELVASLEQMAKAHKGDAKYNLKFRNQPDKMLKADDMVEPLKELNAIMKEAVALEKPNFFAIGYYLTFENPELPAFTDIKSLNKTMRDTLDSKFMTDFIDVASNGVKYSYDESIAAKKNAIEVINKNIELFSNTEVDKNVAYQAYKELVEAVEAGIDRLQVIKDSIAYVFRASLKSNIDFFFARKIKNAKEVERFEKQTAKHESLIAKNKNPDWKVVPADIVDLAGIQETTREILNNIKTHYEQQIVEANNYNAVENTVKVIDYLKEKASNVVYKVTQSMARNKALKIMEEVGIPEVRKRYYQYPFEFSGGMRQRIVIAIALSANPDILICDEPTTALDVTIQAQILELINKLKAERHLSVIFITHDLGVVANMADKIAVMYAGKIVELGSCDDIFYRPTHPYTWALLSSMPDLDTKEKLDAIPGTPPNMIYPPVGDAFAARNKYAMEIDFEEQPPMFKISDTHSAATWLLHPDAPKIDPPKAVTDRIARMMKRGEQNGK